MYIPFNKPFLTGSELNYINEAINSGKISGNGIYTKKCHEFFQERFGFTKTLMTTSCTDALEMSALLLNVKPGDEIIMPSYTFVSTANAFILRGAKVRFVDSRDDHPGMDESKIEELVTEKTKAIIVVHYAGVAVDMDIVMDISKRHNLFVVEDAAQAIDSYYRGKPLGGIGHLSAFSFHETKNIISGEGGLLSINSDEFIYRSEIIWEKGTNRSSFFRGEVDKYGWVDIGSSFLPSELISSFLYAQLENLEKIQKRRLDIWKMYHEGLKDLSDKVKLPSIPSYATNNAHMFYLVCSDLEQRNSLLKYLKSNGIHAVFHYQSLHESSFFEKQREDRNLKNTVTYSNCLVRLPLFFELKDDHVSYIVDKMKEFYS